MVNANRKMQEFSEIQFETRKTGEYIMAFKASNQSDYPVFIEKSKTENDSYQYSVGNKEMNYKVRSHKTFDSAIDDLKHFIDLEDMDKVKKQLKQLEDRVKQPNGKKLYNLEDF